MWKDEFIDGELRTGIPAIDNDEVLQTLDDQICELCSSCYEFDSHDHPCWLNEGKEKVDKPHMPELLGKLNARIAELNDGSFVMDDQDAARRGVVAGEQANVIKVSAPFGALAFSSPHIKLPSCSPRPDGSFR